MGSDQHFRTDAQLSAPTDPQFAERIGASLASVAPGVVEMGLPYRDELTQQKGYVHGGVVGMTLAAKW
jgi:acyl-coenzyme A thioesterase PaaI-like protein